MKGRKGSTSKKAAQVVEAPVPVPEKPEINEVAKELERIELETAELFKGQESWAHGDNLEVLKLRVGSTIKTELNSLAILKENTKHKPLTMNGGTGIPENPPQQDNDNNDEQTLLGKLIEDLMKLSAKEATMKNKIGFASLSNQSTAYDSHRAENHANQDQSMLTKRDSNQVALFNGGLDGTGNALQLFNPQQQRRMGSILIDKIKKIPKPTWHAPWKLKRVNRL